MSEQPREFWIFEGNIKLDTYDLVSKSPLLECSEQIHVIEHSAYEQLQQENARLKEQLRVAVEALKSVAANEAVGDVDLEGHFEGYQNYELVTCIVNDTELARKVLKQIESAGE